MKRKIFYFPELDALRTFAVILTLIAHFFPAVGWKLIPYSWYGVDIFFTISGFLITYILLLTKDTGNNRLKSVGNFMIRRSLRLFPVYYLFLLCFFLAWKFFNLFLWKQDFTLYFFTYTPNILFFQTGLGYGHPFSHLWSLGVEEQFYLIWPWIILFTNKKWLMPVIIFFICTAIFVHGLGYQNPNTRSLPFANFHTLGVGALLAWMYHYKSNSRLMKFLQTQRMNLFLFVLLTFIIFLCFYTDGFIWLSVLREIGLSLVTLSFVLVSIYGWKGLAGITRHPVTRYLGRISYGIYLFHLPIPTLLHIVFEKAGITLSNPFLLFFIYVSVTILSAAISFRFIENRFLRMKKRFE